MTDLFEFIVRRRSQRRKCKRLDLVPFSSVQVSSQSRRRSSHLSRIQFNLQNGVSNWSFCSVHRWRGSCWEAASRIFVSFWSVHLLELSSLCCFSSQSSSSLCLSGRLMHRSLDLAVFFTFLVQQRNGQVWVSSRTARNHSSITPVCFRRICSSNICRDLVNSRPSSSESHQHGFSSSRIWTRQMSTKQFFS